MVLSSLSFGLEVFLEDDLAFLVRAASTIALVSVSGLDSTSLEDSKAFFLSITSCGSFLLVWRQSIVRWQLFLILTMNQLSDLILNGSC